MPCAASRPVRALLVLTLIFTLLAGCAPAAEARRSPTSPPEIQPTRTPLQAAETAPTATVQPTLTPQSTASPSPNLLRLWLSDNLPQGYVQALRIPEGVQVTDDADNADLLLGIYPAASILPAVRQSSWVYALVAPFPTVVDEVSYTDLLAKWRGGMTGGTPSALKAITLLMAPETQAVFENLWQPSRSAQIKTVAADQLLQSAWQTDNTWAIVPFEQIDPRWKVLKVDGVSPFDRPTASEHVYPLTVQVDLVDPDRTMEQSGSTDAWADLDLDLPTNLDPAKLTTLVMTGVTALARRTAEAMEREGVTFPARDIGPLLREADLTHISNEVSFNPQCTKPRPDLRFCSHPDYIELLEAAGADIIELTGNHNLDWGPEPYLYTLDLYAERDWLTFGGGANLEAAQEPLLVTHNGNRLAFIGCSPAGPSNAWAGESAPGSAPCDLDGMEEEVRALRDAGYLPVVTFQHIETDWYVPTVAQGVPDFKRMADAGAVVVQGSQAHFPQTMTLALNKVDGEPAFIHYGLGNLFFDQMEPKDIRQAFIDRHVFYDGRYLGVELVTTMLEDAARPRPMTADEREAFLSKVFELSDWSGISQ